ncbi:hypothetical protein C815_01985 [Firmicutes bacterium M10-2]|nr:hypothetical protein C815_01985 [Firmicutes bacterium M10-2]
MHSLYIAQKFFSLWGTYEVFNENGAVEYRIKGSPSLTRTLTVYDAQDHELGKIHQVFMSFLACFEILRNDEKIGTIQRKFSFFHPKLIMNYMGWQASGNIWGWNYKIYDDSGREVGTINTKIWHLTDQFSIEYERKEDALPLLMLVLAIDAIQDAASRSS